MEPRALIFGVAHPAKAGVQSFALDARFRGMSGECLSAGGDDSPHLRHLAERRRVSRQHDGGRASEHQPSANCGWSNLQAGAVSPSWCGNARREHYAVVETAAEAVAPIVAAATSSAAGPCA